MINNRLIADNTIKTPLKGTAVFAVSKKLIAFQVEKCIRIKTLHRQTKDIDIPFASAPLYFSLSQTHSWLLVLTASHLLEIYFIEYISGINEGSYKKVAILHGVHSYRQNKWGLAIGTLDRTLKVLSYKQIADKTEVNLNIDCTLLKSLAELENSYILTTEANSQRILLTKSDSLQIENAKEPITEVIDRVNKSAKFEKYSSISYLTKILSFYRDRYVFQQKDEKQVEIIDIEQSKVLGKFNLQGTVKYNEIRQNLFLIVTTRQNNDYFNFIVLNPQPSSTQPLITNRACYQKGKGDYIKFYNLSTSQTVPYLDKKKNVEITDFELTSISDNTSSLVYILNKAKEKVEVIKLDHSKLLKSPFGQQKVDMIVYSKKSEKEIKSIAKQETNQIERSRVHSTIEHKVGGESMEDIQKRFVENLIDIKLKNVLKKFDQLQTRVANLQKLINGINSKIDQNLQKVNRKQIKLKVQQLFETLTPQFEKYFSQIFKQVSGVFEQGITYYNLKLAKEADFHKQALTQVVTETFKFTEEVAEISRKEQSVSQKTQEYLKKIMETKKKWGKATQQVETKTKEVPSPVLRSCQTESSKTEGKVFVRADLNFPNSKKDT